MKRQMIVAVFTLLMLALFCLHGHVSAFGQPDYLPDGAHPRIWLTGDRLNEMRGSRDANNPDWVALNAWLTSNYPATNYNLKCLRWQTPRGGRSIGTATVSPVIAGWDGTKKGGLFC